MSVSDEIYACYKCGCARPEVFLAWEHTWLCDSCNNERLKFRIGGM